MCVLLDCPRSRYQEGIKCSRTSLEVSLVRGKWRESWEQFGKLSGQGRLLKGSGKGSREGGWLHRNLLTSWKDLKKLHQGLHVSQRGPASVSLLCSVLVQRIHGQYGLAPYSVVGFRGQQPGPRENHTCLGSHTTFSGPQ